MKKRPAPSFCKESAGRGLSGHSAAAGCAAPTAMRLARFTSVEKPWKLYKISTLS